MAGLEDIIGSSAPGGNVGNHIKTLAQRSGLSEEGITRQLSQILPGRRQTDTEWPPADTLAELSQL